MSLIRTLFAKPTFSVLPINADRAEECERLHAASFAYSWSSADFESYLTDAIIVADGAVNDIAPKGPLGGFILSRLMPPDAELLTVAVDPVRRGTGLGRALLEKHLVNLERGGALLVFLEVAEDNPAALALYARAGFKTIGRREQYYRRVTGDACAALTMRLEL